MWLLISSILIAAASIWVFHLILEKYLKHFLECETNEVLWLDVWQESSTPASHNSFQHLLQTLSLWWF